MLKLLRTGVTGRNRPLAPPSNPGNRGFWRKGLLAAALGLLGAPAWAQVSSYAFSQSVGTYAPISGGTVLGNTGSDDEQFNDPAVPLGITTATAGPGFPIGFSFVFNGITYDRFAVNNNGWIALGNSSGGTSAVTARMNVGSSYTPIGASDASPTNVIAGFARDLQGQTGSVLRFQTIGSAPSRQLVVQWSGYRKWNVTGDNFNFQIILNEGTNTVQTSYGAFTNNATSTTAQAGLRGASNADFLTRTGTGLNATTAGASATSTTTTNAANLPTSGRTFTFTAPTCFVPSGIAVVPNANTTSANVSFTAPAGGTTPVGYNYQYRTTVGPGAWQGPFPSAGTAFNITGLTAGTSYDLQIQSNCGGGDLSAFSATITFSTLCSPSSATLTQNFESTSGTSLPACWNRIVAGTGALVQSTTTAPVMGLRQGQLTAASAAATTNRSILISPPLADLGSGSPRQLRFRARASVASGATLRVGTINNVGPAGTFTDIQLALPLTTSYQDFNVDYTAYAGANSLIAFRHGQDEGGSGSSIFIDNISWEPQPACPSPSALTASNPSGSTVNLAFSPNGANQVDLWWTTSAAGDPNVSTAGGTLQTGITGTTYTATGLSSLTQYFFWMRSNCGGGNNSTFVGPVSATTLVAPINVNVTGPTPTTFSSIQTTGSTFTWLPAGTFANGDEGLTQALALPFSFNYLGSAVTQFQISANGFLTFDTRGTNTSSFTNALGGTTFTRVVAPFWEDLVVQGYVSSPLNETGLSKIRYQVDGSAPNRVLTVEWGNMTRFNFPDANITFQVKLYEGSNNIEFVYGGQTFFLGNVAPTIQWSYSLGLNGNPVTNNVMSQQLENTRSFANLANNTLSIQPLCDSKYTFTQSTPYVNYVGPAPTAPANDNCAAAQSLTINNVSAPATLYCTTFTTNLATASGGASCPGGNADDDVWFTFVTSSAPSTNVNVRVGGSFNFDPVVQVYQGTGCGALSQLACVDATGASLSESYLISNAPANTRYYVRVYHKGTGTGGNGTFVIDVFGLPNPPANDNCASAVALGATVADCGAVTPASGTTFAATSSAVTTTCGGTPSDDVWYTFTVPAGPLGTTGATVNVAGVTPTMIPSLEILSGTCGSLTSIVCATASVGGGTASVTRKLAPGTYYVRVYGSTGQFTICAQTAVFVGNDDAADASAGSAYDLTPTATCTPTTNGTTVAATGPHNTSTNWFSSPDDDVWYSFQATTAATNITVVATSATFATVIEAYATQPAGGGGAATELDDIAGTAGLSTTLELTGLTIGQRYWFRVFSSGTTERSAFTVCVQEIVPPANDNPSGAAALTSALSCVNTLGTVIGATNTTTGPAGQVGATGLNPAPKFSGGTIPSALDVWYSFTTSGAASSRTITVEPTGTNNTTFDPVIQVLTYNSGTNAYTQVAFVDDINPGFAESLTLTGLAAGTYYVRVYNTQDAGTTNGQFNICLTNGAKFLQGQPNVQQASTATVSAGTTNNPILWTEIIVGGATGTLPWTVARFRAVNTSNADVTTVKLWQSTDLTFTPGVDTQVGSTTLVGGDAVFNNISTDLPIGATYFFLTYDLPVTATPGNTVDAQVLANQFTINGVTYPSTLRNPTGTRTITPPPPANDVVCGYVTLPVAVNGANVTYQQFSNATATTDLPAPTCQTSYSKDVWFRVPVPANRNLYISLLGGAAPATSDQILQVFSSSNNQCSGTLTQQACDDDSGPSLNSAIGLTGIPGTVSFAYIRVSSFGTAAAGGNFLIGVSDRPLFTGFSSTAFDMTNLGTVGSNNFHPQFDLASSFAGVTVTVPAGLTNNPVMAANQTVGGLAIAPGASFTLNGTATLTVGNGGFTNRGTFTQATGSTVLLSGTAPVSLGNAGVGQPTMTFENLSIGANGASLAGPVNVRRVLTLSGTLTTNGKALTLVSNATTSAMVVHNTGGNVAGNVTVQRYIDPSISTAPTTYRHLSAPVATTVGDLATASAYFVPRVNPTWNSDTTSLPFPTVFAYDESRISTGRPRFVDGYFSPNATTSPMTAMRGYSALMPDGANPDFVGVLNTGNFSATGLDRGSLTNQGWHLLGNCYPAPIDWATVTNAQIPGMNGAIAVLRSTAPNSAAYVSYVNGVGPAKYLGVGQGFLIRTNAVGVPGSVSLTNANRVTAYQNPAVYRPTAETRPLAKLTLVESGKPVLLGDETYVYFEQGATPVADQYFDAFKLRSTGETPSIFTVAGNEELAINGLPELSTTQETLVPLGIQVGVSGNYKLNLSELLNIPAGMPVVLRDAVTGTEQDLTQNPQYTFTMDASFRGQRFMLVFNPQGRVTGLSGLNAAQLAIFPNPVADKASLQVQLSGLPTTVKEVTAKLVDALGRVVATRQLTVANGEVATTIESASLSNGVYILKLTAGEQTVTRRVVIE